MLDFVVFALLGIIIGTFTGLIPGIHINVISILVFSLYHTYSLDPLLLSVFIVAMGVTHSFLDFIPSIFLGAPDPATALSVLPAHRMLFEGRGYEALVLSVVGGLISISFLFLLFPLLLKLLPTIYNIIRPHIHFVLSILILYMIFLEKKKLLALFIFLLSGMYGLISLNSGLINQNFILFPMLGGLFGISTLVLSYKTTSRIPKQKTDVEIKRNVGLWGGLGGFIGGVFAGLLPGFGSSQSAVLVQEFGKIKDNRRFIATLGGINTIDILLSIFALYIIGNPRSGSAVIIGRLLQEITLNEVLLFLGIGLLSAGFASLLALKIGKNVGSLVQKVNYKKLVLSVLIGLLSLIYVFTGFLGIFISIIGASIGMLPHLLKIKKTFVLGCLILPTILYFSGFLFKVILLLRI